MNTTKELAVGPDKVMDVREIPCSVKHGLIVRTFQELAVDDYFILLNDHNPLRLREQFATQWPDTFAWQYLELGPHNFRIKITKVQELPADTIFVAPNCGGH